MILINLLPHREFARQRRRESFYATMGAFAVAGVLLAGVVYVLLDLRLQVQQQINQMLQNEITRLDVQIKDVADLQTELEALRARRQAVEGLQTQRNQPVRLLNELVRQLPEGVRLTGMSQAGLVVNLTGEADNNERVSELLRNLAGQSQWLAQPELIEIVAASVNVGNRGAVRVSSFSIRAQIKAPPADAAATKA